MYGIPKRKYGRREGLFFILEPFYLYGNKKVKKKLSLDFSQKPNIWIDSKSFWKNSRKNFETTPIIFNNTDIKYEYESQPTVSTFASLNRDLRAKRR